MNSLWDIRIFLGLVPKESHCICKYICNHFICTHPLFILFSYLYPSYILQFSSYSFYACFLPTFIVHFLAVPNFCLCFILVIFYGTNFVEILLSNIPWMDQAIQIPTALLRNRKKPDVLLRVKPNSTYSLYVNLNKFALCPLNPYLAGNILLVTVCFLARGDIWPGRMTFNPFFDKTAIERRNNFENLRAVYFRNNPVHY